MFFEFDGSLIPLLLKKGVAYACNLYLQKGLSLSCFYMKLPLRTGCLNYLFMVRFLKFIQLELVCQ